MNRKYYSLSGLLLLTLFNASIASAQSVPELMYYKFDDVGSTAFNAASTPVGTNPSPIVGVSIGTSGQFGSGLLGTGGASNLNSVNNGWQTSLGNGPWTISMWLNNFPETVTGSYYLFGDEGAAFRCYTGGIAGNNNLMLRGNGISDVTVASVGSAPVVIHFVHEVAPVNAIKVYKNGVLVSNVAQSTALNLTGTGFKIGGYSLVSSLPSGCQMDEFRMYNRALSAGEVASTWNVHLGGTVLSEKLIDFTANMKGKNVELEWIVGNDYMVDEFVIEKSDDGERFDEIGVVKGSTSSRVYTYQDDATKSGSATTYYRLVLKDRGGKEEFSRIVKVSTSIEANRFILHPNPFNDKIQIIADVDQDGQMTLRLVDIQGRVVYRQTSSMKSGQSVLNLDGFGGLAKGLYNMRIELQGTVYQQKLVK